MQSANCTRRRRLVRRPPVMGVERLYELEDLRRNWDKVQQMHVNAHLTGGPREVWLIRDLCLHVAFDTTEKCWLCTGAGGRTERLVVGSCYSSTCYIEGQSEAWGHFRTVVREDFTERQKELFKPYDITWRYAGVNPTYWCDLATRDLFMQYTCSKCMGTGTQKVVAFDTVVQEVVSWIGDDDRVVPGWRALKER